MNVAPVNDFTFYWTAARQLLAGQNPYAQPSPHGFVMLAPPWVFPVTLGFGALPLQLAQFLWLAVSVMVLTISVIWLRELYSGGQSPLVVGLLVATFSPVLAMLLLGQIVPLALFGLAGFLRYEPKRKYLAGVLLFLASLKPQILFLVWAALLLNAFFQAQWKVLAGFIATLSSASLFSLFIRPSIFREYWMILRSKEISAYQSSTLGTLLSRAFGPAWMQYLPMAIALLWLVWRSIRVGHRWEWRNQIPGLAAISIATTPYAWFSDQAVLLPAVLYAEGRLWRKGVPMVPAAAIYFLLSLSGLGLVVARRSSWYAWMPLLWLIFYAGVLHAAEVTNTSHADRNAAEPDYGKATNSPE